MLKTLITALLIFAPKHVTEGTAHENAAAALHASQETGVPAKLLLAMAYHESKYSPEALSRMQCGDSGCKRTTGMWTSTKRPPGSRPTFYCGIMQVGGWVSWEECLRLRNDTMLNYLTGAQHLVSWMNDPYCDHLGDEANLTCALRGYSGGYPAIKAQSTKYVSAIYLLQRKIERAISKVDVS